MAVSELKREGEEANQKLESVWYFLISIWTFAYQGERVHGFAYKTFKAEKDASVYQKDDSSLPKENLCFLCLVSLVDPPRDGVAEAVKK